jgi:hypothetical protein
VVQSGGPTGFHHLEKLRGIADLVEGEPS